MRQALHQLSRSMWRIPLALCLMAGLAVTGYSSAGATVARTAASSRALQGGGSCVKGTGQGITSSTVRLAVTVVDISGGSLTNATVGVPSPTQQQKYWNLVAKSVNKSGGAGCRKVQLSFYNVNPIDAAGAEQSCLTIANSHPYMVLDVGALSDVNASNCIPTAKVAFASQYLTPDQLTKYYPYYLQPYDVPTDALRNGILGLKQLGYFSAAKGFKKLGVIYATCNPTLAAAQNSAIKAAGIPASKVVEFNLGCPAGQAYTPAALEQAVLSFKNGGVTDVTSVAGAAMASFTEEAAQQKYKPIYALNNDQISVPNQTGIDAGNAASLKGAVNIIGDGYGEESTPGFKPSGGTKTCDAIFAAAGLPNVYKQLDGYGGVACNYLWFVQAILNHATSLQTTKLPSAIHAIGSIAYSYPGGPIDYTAAPKGSVYGVGYWRPEYFVESCKCWQVPNPTWHPPFK